MYTVTNNLLCGKVLIPLDRIDSTNNYAKQLLAKSRPVEGTAIIAHQQTHGKGQYGNIWLTEPGQNLTVSVVLYPNFVPAAGQFIFNKAVALAVRECLQLYLNEPVMIKWPNDIYCQGLKLSGILIENTIQGANLSDSIVGIGINANQQHFQPGMGRPGSLKTLTGEEVDLNRLFHNLMAMLEKWYLLLRAGQKDRIRAQYLQHLYQRDEWYTYKNEQGSFTGRIIGVNEMGQLAVETENGLQYFNNKEIVYL